MYDEQHRYMLNPAGVLSIRGNKMYWILSILSILRQSAFKRTAFLPSLHRNPYP